MGAAPQVALTTDVEHLKMIQAVVSRLAQNSFQTKSWSVTVVTAILAFSSRSAQEATCALAFFPAICFWMLDAYYLREERLFRALYVAAVTGEVPRFSMDKSAFETKVSSWPATMLAPAIVLVHAIILVVITIVITFALK